MRAVALALLTLVVSGSGGPGRWGGDWPIFRGSPGLTGVAAGNLPDPPTLAWTFQAGGAITSSPVVAGGRVYFGSDDQKVHCLDAATGTAVWAFETGDMIEAPPLVVDGTVFVGSSDFFFYALDAATGELRWKSETDDKILGGANALRAPERLIVVVGSYDSYLRGYDGATGEELWRYATDNYVNGTPALAGERVVFGGCDAVLHSVSALTGEAAGRVELGPECHVAGSVAIEDGRVYFGHYGNRFVCIDLASGETIWAHSDPRHPFFSSPAIGPDRVVFGGRDKRLHCVSKADGRELWSFPTKRKVDSSPVIAGDAVVFGSDDGRMYVLALEDGKERWSWDIGRPIVSSPAVAGGRIFIGASDGSLYAFGPPAAPVDGKRDG